MLCSILLKNLNILAIFRKNIAKNAVSLHKL